ncbi:hypothetical protein [Lacticaseibacillus sp. N501-2]|uniref:hypothetical protein n=1 Tax=Lacticaseibacillus salsurae TaxID=3367729 RepID=UPI0038B23C44
MAEDAHHPERKEAVSFVFDLLGPPGSHRFHLFGRTLLRRARIQGLKFLVLKSTSTLEVLGLFR